MPHYGTRQIRLRGAQAQKIAILAVERGVSFAQAANELLDAAEPRDLLLESFAEAGRVIEARYGRDAASAAENAFGMIVAALRGKRVDDLRAAVVAFHELRPGGSP